MKAPPRRRASADGKTPERKKLAGESGRTSFKPDKEKRRRLFFVVFLFLS
jgi:hypothetical protein